MLRGQAGQHTGTGLHGRGRRQALAAVLRARCEPGPARGRQHRQRGRRPLRPALDLACASRACGGCTRLPTEARRVRKFALTSENAGCWGSSGEPAGSGQDVDGDQVAAQRVRHPAGRHRGQQADRLQPGHAARHGVRADPGLGRDPLVARPGQPGVPVHVQGQAAAHRAVMRRPVRVPTLRLDSRQRQIPPRHLIAGTPVPRRHSCGYLGSGGGEAAGDTPHGRTPAAPGRGCYHRS